MASFEVQRFRSRRRPRCNNRGIAEQVMDGEHLRERSGLRMGRLRREHGITEVTVAASEKLLRQGRCSVAAASFTLSPVGDDAAMAPLPSAFTSSSAGALKRRQARYVYDRQLDEPQIASRSRAERRTVLTRDRGLLKRRAVTHGHTVRSLIPDTQLLDVVEAFDLRARFEPFSRCLECNGPVQRVDRGLLEHRLAEYTRIDYDRFRRCEACDAINWPGAHFERLCLLVDSVSR